MAKAKQTRDNLAQVGQNAAEQEANGILFSVNESLKYFAVQAGLMHQTGLNLVAAGATVYICGFYLQEPGKRLKADVLTDNMADAIKIKGYGKSSLYRFVSLAKATARKVWDTYGEGRTGPIATMAASKTPEEAANHLIAHWRTMTNKQRPDGLSTLDAIEAWATGTGRGGGSTAKRKVAAKVAPEAKPEEAAKAAVHAGQMIVAEKVPETLPANLDAATVIQSVRSAMAAWDIPVLVRTIRQSKRPLDQICTALFETVETPDELEEILRAGHDRLNTMRAQIAEAAPAHVADKARPDVRAN